MTLHIRNVSKTYSSGVQALNVTLTIPQDARLLPQEFGVYPRMSALDMLHHVASSRHYKQGRANPDGRGSPPPNPFIGRAQEVT